MIRINLLERQSFEMFKVIESWMGEFELKEDTDWYWSTMHTGLWIKDPGIAIMFKLKFNHILGLASNDRNDYRV